MSPTRTASHSEELQNNADMPLQCHFYASTLPTFQFHHRLLTRIPFQVHIRLKLIWIQFLITVNNLIHRDNLTHIFSSQKRQKWVEKRYSRLTIVGDKFCACIVLARIDRQATEHCRTARFSKLQLPHLHPSLPWMPRLPTTVVPLDIPRLSSAVSLDWKIITFLNAQAKNSINNAWSECLPMVKPTRWWKVFGCPLLSDKNFFWFYYGVVFCRPFEIFFRQLEIIISL